MQLLLKIIRTNYLATRDINKRTSRCIEFRICPHHYFSSVFLYFYCKYNNYIYDKFFSAVVFGII